MSVIEGKVWGSTEPILQSPAVEIHRINVKKWKDYGLCDSTHLHAGETSIVPAGEMHKFIAHRNTEALEIYWAELNHNDIIRENVGGVGE